MDVLRSQKKKKTDPLELELQMVVHRYIVARIGSLVLCNYPGLKRLSHLSSPHQAGFYVELGVESKALY